MERDLKNMDAVRGLTNSLFSSGIICEKTMDQIINIFHSHGADETLKILFFDIMCKYPASYISLQTARSWINKAATIKKLSDTDIEILLEGFHLNGLSWLESELKKINL